MIEYKDLKISVNQKRIDEMIDGLEELKTTIYDLEKAGIKVRFNDVRWKKELFKSLITLA